MRKYDDEFKREAENETVARYRENRQKLGAVIEMLLTHFDNQFRNAITSGQKADPDSL